MELDGSVDLNNTLDHSPYDQKQWKKIELHLLLEYILNLVLGFLQNIFQKILGRYFLGVIHCCDQTPMPPLSHFSTTVWTQSRSNVVKRWRERDQTKALSSRHA